MGNNNVNSKSNALKSKGYLFYLIATACIYGTLEFLLSKGVYSDWGLMLVICCALYFVLYHSNLSFKYPILDQIKNIATYKVTVFMVFFCTVITATSFFSFGGDWIKDEYEIKLISIVEKKRDSRIIKTWDYKILNKRTNYDYRCTVIDETLNGYVTCEYYIFFSIDNHERVYKFSIANKKCIYKNKEFERSENLQ